MMQTSDIPAVRLPRSALTTLSHRCAGLGAHGVQALREAGYRAGTEVLATLDEKPGELSTEDFWRRLDDAFTRAGLGSLSHEVVSPAVGAVAWKGSAEAAGSRSDRSPVSCHFAGGLLGGVLSRAAGRTVDVLEVRCEGGGERPCWFLYGSVETLRAVRARAPEVREPAPAGEVRDS